MPINATAIQTAQPPSPITGRTDFRPASSRRRATPHATSPQRAPTSSSTHQSESIVPAPTTTRSGNTRGATVRPSAVSGCGARG